MSNYGLPGGGSSADAEGNPEFESLLAQLRLQSAPSPGPSSGPDLPSQFGYNHAGQPYYAHHSNADSPNISNHAQNDMDPPPFLPEAPTPPVGFSHAQYPPGLVNSMAAARGGAGAGDERTAHLLNLLKYSGQNAPSHHHQSSGHPPSGHQSSSQEPQGPPNFAPAPIGPPVIHAPAPAAADPTGLLAALMKGTLQPEPPKPEPSSSTWNQASPPSGTQQYLLNLLNRPKPSQHDPAEHPDQALLTPPPAIEDAKDTESSHGGRSAEPSLVDTLVSRSELDFEHKNYDSPPPKFDSVPHSQHSAHQTPTSSTTPGASGPTVGTAHPAAVPTQILKHPDSAQSTPDRKRAPSERGSVNSPEHSRRKLENPASPTSQSNAAASAYRAASPLYNAGGSSQYTPAQDDKESVADAVSGLAEQADKEAREALARAEQEQEQAQAERAPGDEQFAQPDRTSSPTIKKEVDSRESKPVLDHAALEETKDSADETAQPAQGPVADNWESAEAEEIVVLEETAAPIKVYNLPMKPWMTISLQETEDTRPVFREEAILDIARLKKDFDQNDRNLVSASETYMAYGMSKAGGLRVIRQEDGKDTKLFTDTKDRIFNVAISTSAAHLHPKESIIGTGVSGTVYWVQLKNGERDHLEDAHPEQYGFALPPISAQEGGDAPGGALKTRARPSSMHPDFFAVGRGKSINIIWPSFIFENNLFRNGHDRVVDTEKLMKQCSLKINTGKAGKDFIFSQDDTLVVSLDKSGRVKFWDVRDLTAVKEGSDPLSPMPARTSLEIKEPLMTLTTTPEGEKAWPTSVLLLDKFRPFQKRAALRYMIVGMNQNHTLQLWDLALGKPVQEFNFPHNKESDPVCSVMYHPPSNMIIVGHPTRNSIYFLHLSVPRYNLKSMSQVDYIQRLVAQDSSIPQPELTAVISGVREYSFANKGVLRSLNILENPAATGDGEEPTLFELYAMHSKGVTCLFVKQSELGWNKDNKVIDAIDAVEAGVAKITKLNAPPPQPAETPQQVAGTANDGNAAPQIRIATRGSKDALLKIPSPQAEEKKAPESVTPPKLERKEEAETPAPAPEKPEKNRRKKKGGAGAAAAAAAAAADREQAASNGVAEHGRASQQTKAAKSARTVDASDLPSAANLVSQEHLDSVIAKMESRIVGDISGRFDAVFNEILKQMQTFQESRDTAFASNQSTLLQMVADVLNDNTESVLKNLIITQINNNVIPSVRSTIDKSVSEQLGAKTSSQVGAIQKEVQKLLPNAVNQAMQKPDVVKAIADKVCQSVNVHVEAQIAKSFNTLASALAKSTAQSVHQRVLEDVNGRINEVFERLEERRRGEDAKLERLIAQTQDLANVVSSFAASQAQIQKDLASLKHQISDQARERVPATEEHMHTHAHAQSRGSTGSRGLPGPPSRELVGYPAQHAQHQSQAPAASHAHQPQHGYPHQPQHQFGNQEQQMVFAPASREERQKMELNNLIEAVDNLMRSGNYDEAMLRWLQSSDRAEEVFQQVISNYNVIFVHELQPLLLLSVAATVSVDLTRNTPKLVRKVAFLETVIYAFSQNLGSLDDQVREVTPKIMTLLKARIEQLFLDISRVAPHDTSLKTLSNMSQTAGRIAENVQLRHGAVHAPGHLGAPY
ncbi:hypothetical protein VTK26DRAFT_7360 [Humicola hyalothermophila]